MSLSDLDPSFAAPAEADHVWVRRLARCLVLDDDEAEDVAQAAWLRVFEREDPRNRGSLEQSVRQSAFVRRRTRARARRREMQAALSAAETKGPPDDDPEVVEARGRMIDLVRQLRPEFRHVIVERYYEGTSAADIAKREGVAEATIRSRLRRALEHLRHRMEGDRDYWRSGLVALAPGVDRLVTAAPTGISAALALGLLGVLVLGAGAFFWLDPLGLQAAAPIRPAGTPSVPKVSDAPTDPKPLIASSPVVRPRPLVGRARAGGRPVPGARLFAFPERETRIVSPDVASRGCVRGETDGSGRFLLELPTDGAYSLLLQAGETSPALVCGARRGDELTIDLQRSAILQGKVTDGGAPVVGAKLRWVLITAGVRVTFGAETDEQGRYVVSGIPSRAALQALPSLPVRRLTVEVEGRAPFVTRSWPAPDAGARLTSNIPLPPGRTVVGRLVDERNGLPVAGAAVVAWSGGEVGELPGPVGVPLLGPDPVEVIARTRTDARGGFALTGLPMTLDVQPQLEALESTVGPLVWIGFQGREHGAEVRVVSATFQGRTVDLGVVGAKPLAVLRGRVVDPEGQPVPDALVDLGPRDHPSLMFPPDLTSLGTWTRTDAAGRYHFGLRTNGPEQEVLSPAARWPATLAPTLTSVDVRVRAGEDREAPDIVLPARTPVHVRVTDPTGHAVSDAAVLLGSRAHTLPFGRRPVWTDADGLAVLGTAPDASGNFPSPSPVTAFASGHGRSLALAVPWRADLEPLAVSLTPRRRVTGRVRSADLDLDAVVVLANGDSPADTVFANPAVLLSRFPTAPEAFFARLLACADVGFFATDLPPGPLHVLALVDRGSDLLTARATARADSERAELTLEPGPTLEGERGRLVATAVEASTGRPIPFLKVRVVAADGTAVHGRPIGPSASVFEGLPLGAHDVEFFAPGFPLARVDDVVVESRERVAVARAVLPRLDTVGAKGRILFPLGVGTTGRGLRLTRVDGPAQVVETHVDEEARFSVSGLVPDALYGVEAWHRDLTGVVRAFVGPVDDAPFRTGAMGSVSQWDIRVVDAGDVRFRLDVDAEDLTAAVRARHQALLESAVIVIEGATELRIPAKGLLERQLAVLQHPGTYRGRLVTPGRQDIIFSYTASAAATVDVPIPFPAQ